MTLPFEPARRRTEGEAGFTLIELLVVLTVMALLFAVVPSVLGGLPGVRFHRAARDLTGALRLLHADAIGSGRTVTVTFDRRLVTWSSSADPTVHRLSPAVDRMQLDLASPLAAGEPPVIRFLTDGSATAATVRLWSGSRTAAIRIDWVSGQVSLDD